MSEKNYNIKIGYNFKGKEDATMKKFGKFVFTTVSIAAAIGGAVYFVKKVLNKDNNDDFDDFDDFDDDFDDFDLDADDDDESTSSDRGYVTLNRNEDSSEESAEESSETVSEEASDDSAEAEDANNSEETGSDE